MALQDVRVDSTLEGVPPKVVCRIIRAFFASFPRFPSSRNTQRGRVDFDIDSVVEK